MPPQRGYDTNLASEFYVMATLARLGLAPQLTLGNKKAVDIVVPRDRAPALTVEVKANAAPNDWWIGRVPLVAPTHFLLLLNYEGRFGDVTVLPRCWVVPSGRLVPLLEVMKNGTTHYLRYKRAKAELADCEGAWAQLLTP